MSQGVEKSAENIEVNEPFGNWFLRGDTLLFQPSPDAVLLHYQLELLPPQLSGDLLFPHLLSAYSPPLLAYELPSCGGALAQQGGERSLNDYLSLFRSYGELRQSLSETLLDYRRIVLHPELIFTRRSRISKADVGDARSAEGDNAFVPLFLYLPLAESEDDRGEKELEDSHAAALSLLIERAVLQGRDELRVDERLAADWIRSSYGDFQEFRRICLELTAQSLSGQPYSPFRGAHKDERGLSGRRSFRFGALELPPFLKAEPLLLLTSLGALFLANALLLLPSLSAFRWRSELALLCFLIAAAGLALALLHPQSAYASRRTRYQAEQGELLRELGLDEKTAKANTFTDPAQDAIYPAYLYTLPSAQGKRLRSRTELAALRAEASLFGQSLILGSDPAQSDLSLGFEGEAKRYCKLWSDHGGAWCALLEPNVSIKIDGRPLEANHAQSIPDHCLLEIGPCLREFYRESCV